MYSNGECTEQPEFYDVWYSSKRCRPVMARWQYAFPHSTAQHRSTHWGHIAPTINLISEFAHTVSHPSLPSKWQWNSDFSASPTIARTVWLLEHDWATAGQWPASFSRLTTWKRGCLIVRLNWNLARTPVASRTMLVIILFYSNTRF